MQTVETVEKVSWQKFLLVKWEKNRKVGPVFCVRRSIETVFMPQVGDFSAEFARKGFFDSLVSPQAGGTIIRDSQEVKRVFL